MSRVIIRDNSPFVLAGRFLSSVFVGHRPLTRLHLWSHFIITTTFHHPETLLYHEPVESLACGIMALPHIDID